MSISLDQYSKYFCSLFLLYAKLRAIKSIETKLQTIAFTSYKAFLGNKKRSGTSSLAYFLHDFSIKVFIILYSTWPNLFAWLPMLREILGNMCITIVVCWSGCDVINFGINLVRRIKPFFVYDQKVKTNI